MAFWTRHRIPYVNFHELNEDWIIEKVFEYVEKTDKMEINFNDLKTYVMNYFDNLDVQNEINNKLDEMYELGQLSDIIQEYLQVSSLLTYNTIADLKNATNLIDGVDALCLGKTSYLDGKSRYFKIRTLTSIDVVDEIKIYALNNYPTLIAEIIPQEKNNVINVLNYGAIGDGETDNTTAFTNAMYDAMLYGIPLFIPNGVYVLSKNSELPVLDVCLNITNPLTIIGDGYETILKNDWNLLQETSSNIFNISNTSNVIIKDLTIDGGVVNNEYFLDHGTHGIRIDNSNNLLIENVKILNTHGYGIGGQNGTISNLTIKHCYIDNTGLDGIDIKNYNNTNYGIKILECFIAKIGMNPNVSAQDAQCAIDVRGEMSIVDGCQLYGIPATRNGIRLRLTDTGGTGIGGRESVISNCTIYGASNNTGIGVMLDDTNCTISNCYIRRMGIGMSITTNQQLINNITFDRCSKGIQLNGYGAFFNNCVFGSLGIAVDCNNTNAVFFTNCLFSGATESMFKLNSSNKINIAQSFARGTIATQFDGNTSNVKITQCENIAI